MRGNRRRAFGLRAALLLLPLLASTAAAQENPEVGRALQQAKELLRTGKVEDRIEAIRRLTGRDSATAITCLEEAIQRSAAVMDKLARDVDSLATIPVASDWRKARGAFLRERSTRAADPRGLRSPES